MTIDWIHFTPWASLAGGLLIGLAAAVLILVNGRIAGISGILGNMLLPGRGDFAWRALFIAGLVISPLLYRLVVALPRIHIEAGPARLVIAGLLVGIGTRYAAGCTSGHGVCGLSRMSVRSLAATLAFMAAGFLTVFMTRHVFGG